MKAFLIGTLAILFLPTFLIGFPPPDGTGAEKPASPTRAKAESQHVRINKLRVSSDERLKLATQEPRADSQGEASGQLKKRLADVAERSKSAVLAEHQEHQVLQDQLATARAHLATLRSLSAPDLGTATDGASASPPGSDKSEE